MTETNNTVKNDVSLREKLIFASADLYGGGAGALIGAIYFVYLVAMGVGTVQAGIIIAVARIWDAITDPLMGIISDNTRTKWGRRRPYILFGGMLVIASLAFLFLPLQALSSQGVKFAIYLLGYMTYNTVSTIINVSYSSMSTELAKSPKETTQVNTLRLLFSMVSGAIATVGGTFLLDKFFAGYISIITIYLIVVFGFGTMYTVPLILTGLFTKERVILPQTKSTFTIKTFLLPFKIRSFRYLLIGYLCAFVCMDLLSTNIVYFANYAISAEVGGTPILAIIMVCTGLTLPIYYKLMAKGVAKPFLFRLGIPLYIVGIILLTMVPISNKWLLFFFCVLIGLGMGGSQMLPWIIFPDVVDVAQLQLNDRPTGSFSGVMTFTKKCSSAIAIFLSGVILELIKFNKPVADISTGKINYLDFPQSEGTVLGIKLMIMITVVIFMSLAFLSLRKLKLNNNVTMQVRVLIEKRSRNEEYSEEDLANLAKIEKDLF